MIQVEIVTDGKGEYTTVKAIDHVSSKLLYVDARTEDQAAIIAQAMILAKGFILD